MPPKKAKPQKKKADPEPAQSSPSKQVKKSENNKIDWDALPKVKPPNVKAYKENEIADFPEDFEVVKNSLLQVTDIKDNHNKFYSLELHLAKDGRTRLFTHYGRTDDLNTRGKSCGQKETRHYSSLAEGYASYIDIYKKKTVASKGYKELNLVRMNSNIGSSQIQKQQKEIDVVKNLEKQKEMEKQVKPNKNNAKKIESKLNLHPMVQKFVSSIYNEATQSMTSTVTVQITAEGIKTPLGVLTKEQIEKGENCLSKILEEVKKKSPSPQKIEEYSSEFYTMIPHQLGRSQAAIKSSIISTEKDYTNKMDLMQLMKDMLEVSSGEEGNVLYDPDIEAKYRALNCDIRYVASTDAEYKKIEDYIHSNIAHQNRNYYGNSKVNIQNIFEIGRSEERSNFNKKVGNEKFMFHGSRIQNWMGILTRGILLPEAVTKLGVRRTDFGWLGAGIYFGDVWATSASYTGTTTDGSNISFMCVANVALGKIKDQKNVDGSITKPPTGFDSIHGNPDLHGGFSDHEYCIYEQNQQHISYIVEFKR